MSTHRNTGRTPLRASRIARVVTALGRAVVVGGLAIIVACSDTPTALLGPHDGAVTRDLVNTTGSSTSKDKEKGKVKVAGLLRDKALLAPQTRTWTVRSDRGDVLLWAEMGLTVVVPPKAFRAAEMKFSITVLPGDVIAYDFGPDGSQFDVPLQVFQSLNGTNFEKLTKKLGRSPPLRGAYFMHASQIDAATGTAMVDEFQPSELGLKNRVVRFEVTHFSGYMVSTN
jgi:hypothetical protein